MSDSLQDKKEMGFAEKQWAALNQDNTFLSGLTAGLIEKGIQPTEVILPTEVAEEEIAPDPKPTPAVRRASTSKPEDTSSYEEAILTLCEIRDSQVEIFKQFSSTEGLSKLLIDVIRKIEQSVKSLGGSIDPFNPLAELSGLDKSSTTEPVDDEQALLANALKVADNTRNSYTLYSIPKIIVKLIKGHPGILIQIAGEDSGSNFLINGQIVANTDFLGNEAIDYVRTGGEQMFTVKTFRLGKWVDVSSDYNIRFKDVTPA